MTSAITNSLKRRRAKHLISHPLPSAHEYPRYRAFCGRIVNNLGIVYRNSGICKQCHAGFTKRMAHPPYNTGTESALIPEQRAA